MRCTDFLLGTLAALLVFGCTDESKITLEEGLCSFTSQNKEREFYLDLPSGYGEGEEFPLVVAFHGTEGTYLNYTKNQYYNLHGAVFDQAILVYPNALHNENGITQWDFMSDVGFFDDLFV